MIFSTFYFSGTGNTRWAVEAFNLAIREQGHVADALAIDQLQDEVQLKEVWERSDYIGLAQPIYGADIPPIMRRFLGKLQAAVQTQKPVFCINTFGYVNAYGPFATARLLSGLGHLVGYANIRMCNNVSTPHLMTPPVNKKC